MKVYDEQGREVRVTESPIMSKMRVYLGSNQSLLNSTTTKIELDTVDFDTLGEWNPSLFRWVAMDSGYYTISAQIRGINIATPQIVRMQIYKNGVSMLFTEVRSNNNNADPCANITDTVYLIAGDYLEVWGRHSDGATSDITGGSQYTFMSIHELP